MNPFGKFNLFERLRRSRVARGILFGLFVFNLERIRVGALRLEFPVVVDDVIAANPDHPRHERAGLRPERRERSINLEEDLLSQIFGLVKSSCEAVSQIVNPLMVLANYGFPGSVVAGQAAFRQLRIGYPQPVQAPSASCYLVINQRSGAKKSFK